MFHHSFEPPEFRAMNLIANRTGALIWAAFLPPGIRLRRATPMDRAVRAMFFAEMRAPEREWAITMADSTWDSFVTDQFHLREGHYARLYPDADVMMIEARGGAGGRFAVVGTVTVALANASDGRRIARLVTIEIDTASRGRGIGTQVIEAVIKSARLQGLSEMQLSVAFTNTRAMQLYRRLGFQPDASIEDADLSPVLDMTRSLV